MPKFVKKPVEVEARQWDGTPAASIPIINWILQSGGTATLHCDDLNACVNGKHTIRIQTLEGIMDASPQDYVIQGVQGEFYPCKPDIFAESYEAVDA